LSWLDRRIDGFAAAKLNWLNWRTSLGPSRPPTLLLDHWSPTLSARVDSNFRAGGGHRLNPPAHGTHCKRTFLGDSSGLNAAFRPKPSCAQGIAGRVAHSSVAYRNREIEKSDSEPGGKTVHRVCPRGGQAIDETTATYLANRRQTTALRDFNQTNVRCGSIVLKKSPKRNCGIRI
jgi:hypothetical protein